MGKLRFKNSQKTFCHIIAYLIMGSMFYGSFAHTNSKVEQAAENHFVQDPSLELGYLNGVQIYSNKVNPYTADSPVTQDQKSARSYPLLPNPAGFDDEFIPNKFSSWQVVQLGPETGATCGDGSPYKFFINRRPKTVNMVLYFEPGGACLDYDSCTGANGIRGARNPNGLPDDYLNSLGTNAITPIISNALTYLASGDRVEPVDWSSVYIPYCTGDIFSGDRVVEYVNPRNPQETLLWHHNGVRNVRAVLAWLKDNMPRPPQMLATGCSAGGVGSATNYAHIREDLDPIKSYLLNDSGPTFSAPIEASRDDFPSQPLHVAITSAWGLNNGLIDYLNELMPNFDPENLGTLHRGIATQYPNDRLGYTHFWGDRNFSSYSYERFHPDMALGSTPSDRWPLLRSRWERDTHNLIADLNSYDNFGYYIPRQRNFNESHCSTIVTFHNSEIHELNLTFQDFLKNILDGSGPILQASEQDRHDPGYFSFLLFIAGSAIGGGPSEVQPLDEPVVVEFFNTATGKNFGSIIPGSSELTAGTQFNNKWLLSPNNEKTGHLRLVNLSTGKTMNNEKPNSRVVADTSVPNRNWSAQWYPQFTTLAANEIVLGARHGNYIYLSNEYDEIKTIHSPNVFDTKALNNRSKWRFSANFLSELDTPPVRTRDVVRLVNPVTGSILFDTGIGSTARYAPASPAPENAKWLVQTFAEKERENFVILRNAATRRTLNIERANGELQAGNLPNHYWSANWIIEPTYNGLATFKNRWEHRRHRFHVGNIGHTGIAQESNIGASSPYAKWTFNPYFEVVEDFELIPSQPD